MIVITGLGHSGTRAIAEIYHELGFGPGHVKDYELEESFDCPRLGAGLLGIVKDLGVYESGRGVLIHNVVKRLGPYPRIINWKQLDKVTEEWKVWIRGIERDLDVVKDGKFCEALRIFQRAGVRLDHVIVVYRNIDQVILSKYKGSGSVTKHEFSKKDFEWIRNNSIYRLGSLWETILEYKIPYSIVRSHSFYDPLILFKQLEFPKKVEWSDFRSVFDKIVDPDKIHNWKDEN